MKESLRISLKYTGKDVNDGTMSIEDIVPVLQGFASAYGKIVITKGFTSEHKLRITGVGKGSFDIVLEAWEWIGENSAQIQAVGTMTGGGVMTVVASILGIIRLKKHVAKQPYTKKLDGTRGPIVIVKNSKNVEIEIPVEIYTLFKTGLLDVDLAKIVKPLEKGRVDSAEISVRYAKEYLKEKITSEEKPYFETEIVSVAKTKEVWLTGAFNSLTKSTNRGFFILTDGGRVSYRFVSKPPEKLYPIFLYKGPVKIKCIANLDENLNVVLLDISEAEKLQMELFDDGSANKSKEDKT